MENGAGGGVAKADSAAGADGSGGAVDRRPILPQEGLVVAVGVDKTGQKQVLGLWHGATENSTLVRELLADLRARDLNTAAAILVVLDGAQALYKGVREVLGDRALIQRCRIHKLRHVLAHLPLEKRTQAAWRLRGAWAQTTPEEALQELRACVKWRDSISPNAARSLEEGLEETRTVTHRGLPESLVRTFSSTNRIESSFARTESWTGRGKRWRGARMGLRWGAGALLFAEQGFRRVRGYHHLPQLREALRFNQSALAPRKKAAE